MTQAKSSSVSADTSEHASRGLGRRRTLGLHRLFIAILVNHRGDGFAIDTSIAQHGMAGLAAGCENKTMGIGHGFILIESATSFTGRASSDRAGHTWLTR